jgi:hypothetical protein
MSWNINYSIKYKNKIDPVLIYEKKYKFMHCFIKLKMYHSCCFYYSPLKEL